MAETTTRLTGPRVSPLWRSSALILTIVPVPGMPCWAMPGAVALIVLMILAFGAQFGSASPPKDAQPRAVVLAGGGEPGVTAKAATAGRRP